MSWNGNDNKDPWESYQNDLIKLLDIEGFALISKKQIQEAI